MIVQTVTKFLILEHCLSVVLDRLTKNFTPAPKRPDWNPYFKGEALKWAEEVFKQQFRIAKFRHDWLKKSA